MQLLSPMNKKFLHCVTHKIHKRGIVLGLKMIPDILYILHTRTMNMSPRIAHPPWLPELGIHHVCRCNAYVIIIMSEFFCTSCCFRSFPSENKTYFILSSLKKTAQSLGVNRNANILTMKNTLQWLLNILWPLVLWHLTSHWWGSLSTFLWSLRYHFLQSRWMQPIIISKPPYRFCEVS